MMQAANPSNPIHRISVEQYHRLIAASVFDDADRVELIDGEMRDMSPIGPLHGGTTNNLNMLFASRLAGKAIVSVQGPLVIDEDTELYPDLLILKPRDDWYRGSNPTGDDVFLAIEVADSIFRC